MAIPSNKDPEMRDYIDNLSMKMFGRTRTESIKNDICVMCGNPAKEFEDALSEKEYTISGSCQSCQDGIFKEE